MNETTKHHWLLKFIFGVLSILIYLTFFFDHQPWEGGKLPAPASDDFVFQKIQANLPNLPLYYWQRNKEAIHLE